MEPISIGNGKIRVLPLAFESLGVRGMAMFVETDDVKLVIDPGSALGPRFNLRPHECEYVALSRTRQAIIEAARRADVLTISHYHFDHYVPNFEDWVWIWSSPEIAAKIYSGKLILAKDISRNINVSQRKRGYMFHKLNIDWAKEIKVADGQKFKFGDTTLEFSQPVYHGSEDSALGYVLMLEVRTSGCHFLHASDVQGPMCEETLRLILAQRLDAVAIGGPPIYLEGFRVKSTDIVAAQRNLSALAKHVPLLIVDHHLLRSLDYPQYLRPAMQAAEQAGNRLLTAAELMGLEPQLLEARRRELHQQEPVDQEWYKRLERGELKDSLV
jgi:predicted metallo-beta-lactamase superfamily hydrolase